jgi:D-tyrosyl-tRNA(Tyr) deacylase
MIAVIQRVTESSVKINGQVKGEIGVGLMVLLGIEDADDAGDIEWLTRKIINLRIFADDNGVMNRSLLEVSGELLLISQFTLHASTKKGNRPSYIKAAKPDIAIPLYNDCVAALEKELGRSIQTGEFGAEMKVALVNDGPVTIIVDSKNRV